METGLLCLVIHVATLNLGTWQIFRSGEPKARYVEAIDRRYVECAAAK